MSTWYKMKGDTIDTIDYVTRIGNSSRAPIVIVDSATAHPSCDFLPNFVQDSSSSHRRKIA